MEVVIPTMDFDFNSARASPCSTTPSTPKRFGEYYFSAPTSPTQLSEIYRDFDDFFVANSSSSIPFDWEEKPGTPKSPKSNAKFEDDFAFDFSEEWEKSTIPAEELFDGGKIRPLKPPPVLQRSRFGVSEAPKSSIASPKSPISQIRGALSPRKKKSSPKSQIENTHQRTERGRERVNSLSSSSSRRGTRSLSPYRVSTYPWEEEQNPPQQRTIHTNQPNSIIPKPSLSSTTSSLSSSSKSGSKKWRLKDFFLFRSASEGRAADKDPLKKYSALFRKHEDVKCSSFRSIDGSNSGSSSKRKGQVSAHELHYTVNRAVSEDLKKKTFLPYKQGILGRLAFNPAVHALANGFGFSRK